MSQAHPGRSFGPVYVAVHVGHLPIYLFLYAAAAIVVVQLAEPGIRTEAPPPG